MSTADCFVSYSRSDSNIVDFIVGDLENLGFKIWIDRKSMLAGERIRDAINKNIRDTRCVILFLSERSVQSPWVLNEIDIAMLKEMTSRQVILIPLLIGNIEFEQVPADLQGKNCVDLRGDFKSAYRERRTAIVHSIQLACQLDRGGLVDEFIVDKEAFSYFAEKVRSFNGINHLHLNLYADAVASTICEGAEDLFGEDSRGSFRSIASYFGVKGLRDLVSFCILYRELYQQIDDGGDISEEIFRKIMEFVEVFVLVFSINQKIFAAMEHERVPMAVTMGISANGGIAYRMVGLDGYRGVFGSIQEQ